MPRIIFIATHSLLLLAAICSSPASAQESADSGLISEQRRLFRAAYSDAELGNWRTAAKHEALLKNYVLWPDLRAAWLRTRVRNHDYSQVDLFLDQYGILKPARELRYHYALTLGSQGEFPRYLDIYQAFYQGLDVAQLDCLALQAEILQGRELRIINRGIEKWLVGRNQVEECDPVFEHLRGRDLIGAPEYGQRFELAIEQEQFAIARYLSLSLPPDYAQRASQWSGVASNPADSLEQHSTSNNSDEYRRQLAHAAKRIAYKEPEKAALLWRDVLPQYPFTDKQRGDVDRHIALWAARRHTDIATDLLDALSGDAKDAEVRSWQVRTALMKRDWPSVVAIINGMPQDQQYQEEWRFWLAYASQQSGDRSYAEQVFTALAVERSYYGFLAADAAGLEYQFADNPLIADDPAIAKFEQRDSFVRARELFFVGLEGRGRSEWDAAVAWLTAEQKLQASILAHRWGWHSRAIATAATAGRLDDLEIRYPLPYRQAFETHANASNVPRSWAYGIARSESLFMRDIQSSAGAVGLMQLMPETGKRTARRLNYPYAGHITLTNPDSNIRLGTAYMRIMMDRFDDNRVLATAAYNAGPLNVEAWLPESGSIDGMIWIENIPFEETRKYVRRVFATDIIFHWRLTGELPRLTPQINRVKAPTSPLQVAESD